MSQKPLKQNFSLFWPLLLIGVGVITLLTNLEILPPNSLETLFKFWPVALIIIGIDILIGRKSAISSIIISLITILCLGGILASLFFSQNFDNLNTTIKNNIDLGDLKQENLQIPLGEIQVATIVIDWPPAPGKLYPLLDSNNLLEGTINYYGMLDFTKEVDHREAYITLDSQVKRFLISASDFNRNQEQWEIGLHSKVAMDLVLDSSSGPITYDFEDLNIKSFRLDTSSGPITLTLPKTGQLEGFIDGSSGPININLPADIATKIILEPGFGSFVSNNHLKKQTTDEGDNEVWLTENFDNTENYVILTIDQGSGPIIVKTIPSNTSTNPIQSPEPVQPTQPVEPPSPVEPVN